MRDERILEGYSFGQLDVIRLLENTGGNIQVKLTDLGSTWLIRKKYQWVLNGNEVKIRPVDDLSKVMILPRIIHLTPRLIAFIGLYDGDGNKTRDGGREIGFSQREINIHKFANDMFLNIFGKQIPVRWSILEDTRRFDTDEMRKHLGQIRLEIGAKKEIELQREFIKREFLNEAHRVGLKVNEDQMRTPVVSPKKGARAPGKSSLEYIQNLSGTEKFLTLWLKIVRMCTDNIIQNKTESEDRSLIFYGPPHEKTNYFLDVESYIQDVRWKTKKDMRLYKLAKTTATVYLSISKVERTQALVNARLALTPFIFLVAGIYLAEGDTKKDDFFVFETQPTTLKVALTSSEPEYIQAFVGMLETLGKDLVKYWKVKVGTKYAWETEEIAQRLGLITLRAGEKGQGYLRTLELDSQLKSWGLRYCPVLNKYAHMYHHSEITGVGIPRVHVIACDQINTYFISLVRDLAFKLDKLQNYLCR